ncbi:MAG TPA: TerC family protein [Candidatus Binataceae bacterium]|nr:TerC family protein [Candidatus Binataceae bacterium]
MVEVAGSLLLLIVLEIVLGIDNLVFIAILADRLPLEQRVRARRIGLTLALVARIVLLATIDAITELTQPLFFVLGRGFSGRDLILFVGGLFLLYKAVHGIHEQVEGAPGNQAPRAGAVISFRSVITQIVLLDVVFSIDSVITAVGTVDQIWVMVVAVVVAIVIMLAVAGTIADFVNRHPSVKTLALGFLLMIGMSLVADSVGFHIPKGYIYSAMAFAVLIEAIDLIAGHRRLAASGAAQRNAPG